MKRFLIAFAVAVLCGSVIPLLSGCDDDDDTPAVDITGQWLVRNYEGQHTPATFTQNGTTVSGWVKTAQIAGTIHGRHVEVRIIYTSPARLVYVDAMVSQDGGMMSGTWRETNAQGTWSAQRM